MAAEENNNLNNDEISEEMASESPATNGNEMSEDEIAKTLVKEGLDDSSEEDDLETQMATAMAAESLSDSDEEMDLEAQMAAALEENGELDSSMLDALSGTGEDELSEPSAGGRRS